MSNVSIPSSFLRTQQQRPIAHQADSTTTKAAPRGKLIIPLFLIAVVQPIFIDIAGTYLTMVRALLLVMFVPLVLQWVSGKAGRVRFSDFLMIGYVIWLFPAFYINHGSATPWNFLLAQAIETIGPYMLARLYIRDSESFLYFVRCIRLTILCLLPFLMIEAFMHWTLLVDLYKSIPSINVFRNVDYGTRMGLTRAQGSFEHPILLGVYCSLPFALVWYALKSENRPLPTKLFWCGSVFMSAFFALSSGPIFGMAMQIGLMGWDMVLRRLPGRWTIFLVGGMLLYVIADIIIESTPILYLVSNATFSGATAWNRIRIFEFGSAAVIQNPIFGIAMNDWERPSFMSASVDNFWLLVAMRSGFVGFFLLVGSLLVTLIGLALLNLKDKPALADLRTGYIISFCGLALTLATVSVWSATYATIFLFFGSIVWLLDERSKMELLGPRHSVKAPVHATATTNVVEAVETTKLHGSVKKGPSRASNTAEPVEPAQTSAKQTSRYTRFSDKAPKRSRPPTPRPR